ncbi:conserved hypothetical protein [Uncinocarpus reesii 1704]|uniref:AAA+ ATPase domain-containing protein n=1 Tax=Uncinocarpus reesii (strain UAMH 1704) TaxID=336963 RepID=C4JWK6_UNCRE|nr:uncharacterized protein UREG_06948 [Uncinocarpus reesii 1704]EEP82083.1 conserved hypothetical protein [Uncinocarpus reesii 1704]
MGFSTSSKEISLRRIPNAHRGNPITNLCAYCRRDNGTWWYSEITLDWKMSYDLESYRLRLDSGPIDLVVREASNQGWLTPCMADISLTAGGSVLVCEPKLGHKLALALDMFFHNDNGKLIYQMPPQNVRSRLLHFRVSEGGVLSGFALTVHGTLQHTTLDLNEHLANQNGCIVRKRNGNFSWTARDLYLDDDWVFNLSLQYENHTWNNNIQCWELLEDAGIWDLRGPFFRALEEIPVIGYIVAGIDAINGDTDEAIRAAAECTYGTIVLGVGFVAAIFFGPVGVGIASAVAGFAGLYAKAAIGQYISDPAMRNEVTAITIYRVLVSELVVIAGVGIESMSGSFGELLEEELMQEGFSTLVTGMGKMLGDTGLKFLTEKDMEIITKILLDAIRNGLSEDDIKHKFDDYENDGVDLLNPPPPKDPEPTSPTGSDDDGDGGKADPQGSDDDSDAFSGIDDGDLPPPEKDHHPFDEGEGKNDPFKRRKGRITYLFPAQMADYQAIKPPDSHVSQAIAFPDQTLSELMLRYSISYSLRKAPTAAIDPPRITMAQSLMSSTSGQAEEFFRFKSVSQSRRDSSIHCGESDAQMPRVIPRRYNSTATTNISNVVTSLQRRTGEDLGTSASSKLPTVTYATIMEWIRSERMGLMPPEGSDYDKVLAWAQLFVGRLHSFDLAIEQFAGDSYLAAQVSYGYCAMLLELGKENAAALVVSFGFFHSISMPLINLLERTELFNVTQEIQEQLILALSDLVTLIACVSTYFHKAIRGLTTASVSVNIYRAFPNQIQNFHHRCENIVEAMWRHQLMRESLDGDKVFEVKAIRSWLAPEDRALNHLADNSSYLAHDREELTCLWMGQYLTQFLKSQQKHLSIAGPPGSGKTVLASVIVDYLQHSCAGASYQPLLVSINGRIPAQTSYHAIAKSILHQLFEKRIGNVHLFRILSHALYQSRAATDHGTYDAILWDAIDQALRAALHGAKELILVVDGVDEATRGEDVLMQRLIQATSEGSHTKLITLGSQTPPATAEQTSVRITDDIIFDDIVAVVRGILASSKAYLELPSIEQETTLEHIAQAAKSSVLWAKLVTKRIRDEQNADSFRKVLGRLLSAKSTITDLVLHTVQQKEVTAEARLMLLWLATAQRPLHLKELAALSSIEIDEQKISDKIVDTLHVLKPVNSLVYLQNDFFYLRHGLIRAALLEAFSRGKLISGIADQHMNLMIRLLIYIKANVPDSHELSSVPFLDHHDANALLEKNALLDYALRYWVPHFRWTADFHTQDGEKAVSKEVAKVLPGSTTVILLLRSVWENLPTPELVTYQNLVTNIFRHTMGTESVPTLQAIISLATVYRQVKGLDAYPLFYEAAVLSQKLMTTRHAVTMQMALIFLELTSPEVTEAKTDIMMKREEMLLVLIECYKIHYGHSSEKVVAVMEQLVEHYRLVKEVHKAETYVSMIQSTTSTESGVVDSVSGSLQVHLVGHKQKTDQGAYVLSLDIEEEDQLIKTDELHEVQDSIKMAEKYIKRGDLVMGERVYVELWQRVTRQSRIHRSAAWEGKKMTVILAYTNFLRMQNRLSEASSVLTSFWQDCEYTSLTLSESTVTHLQEIAQMMRTVGLSTTALSVLKHCSEYYRNTQGTETSAYQETRELIQTISKEAVQSASSSSTTTLSETILEEMVIEMSTSVISVDKSFYSSVETLVDLYVSQRRWQQAISLIEKILSNTWSSIFVTTLQDVTLPHKNADSALALAERLAQCYHSRYRLSKEQDIRLRIYYAVRSGLNMEDKLRQHHITELLLLLERSSQTEAIISVYQELLADYTKYYGSDHIIVIQTLHKLAELTRPRPIFLDYYQQIIQALNKDGKQCHPDALEPLNIVTMELWTQGRYSEALHYCTILYTAFIQQPKLSPKFQDQTFVREIISRYTQCLRAVSTEYSVLHKVTAEYQTKCKAVFGATASITIQATLALARLCQESRHHEIEAIQLYEELRQIRSEEVDVQEISAALDALYEEQYTRISSQGASESVSSEQTKQVIQVLRKRVSTLRETYGWAHEESLAAMKEIVNLHFKRNETELAIQELQEATRQVLSSETSATCLSFAAETIVSSYIAAHQRQKAVDLLEEVYRQVMMKDNMNVKSTRFDLTSRSRESLVFLAQLEHRLRRQSSTVTEILASLTTELVYFEELHQGIRSKSSFLSVSQSAARLYQFLLKNRRHSIADLVLNDCIKYFLTTEGKRCGFKASPETNSFVTMILHYFSERQSTDLVRSIGIASNSQVANLIKSQRYDEAHDLALASFKYMSNQESYRRSPQIARFVLALAVNVAAHDVSPQPAEGIRKKLLSASATIAKDVLNVLSQMNINISKVGLKHLDTLISALGSQQDYQTLATVLTSIWNSREGERDWNAYVTLALGRLVIMSKYLVGEIPAAVRLAEDIVYNCRRVHGSRHPFALESSILLSQLYIGAASHYQMRKDGHELANRYYKRAAQLHETALHVLADPTFAELDGSLEGETSINGRALETESPGSAEGSMDASITGDHVRHHFNLLKLALQRLGAWPKDFAEYERLNADLYHEYPEALRGIKGVEKWNLKAFGAGKAESDEDQIDMGGKDWHFWAERGRHGEGMGAIAA